MATSITVARRSGGAFARAARLARSIATERTTPARVGLAVGVGVFIGTSPFFGFHLVLCLVVATALGLNRALTYLAANISVPWVAPFLVFASVQAGALVLRGSFLPLDRRALLALDPSSFGAAWLVGSAVIGVLLGLPAGLAAFALARAYRRRRPLAPDPHGELLERAVAAYGGLDRFTSGYVRGKLHHDPVCRQLLGSVPLPGPILDVGCGRGQILILLALAQPGVEGVGLDWDPRKIELARRAAAPWPGLRFTTADVRTAPLPPSGTVLVLDVLHYNPRPVQDEVLRRAARALAPGGVLYVRDVDAGRTWRAIVNIWQERLGRWARLNRGATLCFRPAGEIAAVLAGCGLTVEVVPSHGGLPLANVLFVARRPATSAGPTAPGGDD